MESLNKNPVILTIAGSDSGGGAGIQADSKTITVLGGFATTVITALTAQNGLGVNGVYEIPPSFIVKQLLAVDEGFPIKAAKTGMLASCEIIEALGEVLCKRSYPLVVDPVCVSQSGHRLLKENAVEALVKVMLPLADILTPNKPEAEVLTGIEIRSSKDTKRVLDRLLHLGAKAVLLKGGHFEEYEGQKMMVDWLATADGQVLALPHERVETCNNHGTGCTLSAAIATFLGRGESLESAVKQSVAYLCRALAKAYAPGLGAGPPNFMA